MSQVMDSYTILNQNFRNCDNFDQLFENLLIFFFVMVTKYLFFKKILKYLTN